MKSEYNQIILMSLAYSIIYLFSLIFATGSKIGINFDYNQLIAYILIIVTVTFSLFSFKIKILKYKRKAIKLIRILIILFFILFFSGIIGFNEIAFAFIIPILGLPFFIFSFIFHYLTFNKWTPYNEFYVNNY